jgi:hypothetical protein
LFGLDGFVDAAGEVFDQPEDSKRHEHDGPEYEQQGRAVLGRAPEGRAVERWENWVAG